MNSPDKPNPAVQVLERLASEFPPFRAGLPLAIGIHKAIRQRLPDLPDADLRLALRRHTASTKYLKAVANGTARFDLDGNPAGEISPEHRQDALNAIKERFRKAAERKREERQAQERAQKLQQLAARFNSR